MVSRDPRRAAERFLDASGRTRRGLIVQQERVQNAYDNAPSEFVTVDDEGIEWVESPIEGNVIDSYVFEMGRIDALLLEMNRAFPDRIRLHAKHKKFSAALPGLKELRSAAPHPSDDERLDHVIRTFAAIRRVGETDASYMVGPRSEDHDVALEVPNFIYDFLLEHLQAVGVIDHAGCGPSSPELKTDVANFMERAEKVIAHPLGAAASSFRLSMRLDRQTGDMYSVGFEEPLRPEKEWQTLALAVRPIVFNEQDSISFNVLTNSIEREHALLRGRLKDLKDAFNAWRKYVYLAAEPIGTPASDPPTPMLPPNQMLEPAPGGGFQSSVDITGMSTDYDYADAYLNGMVWHSDRDKARDYQAARPEMRVHYVKCAELRVIASTLYVRNLRQWILEARAAGHDF